jgi:hypothetical protein
MNVITQRKVAAILEVFGIYAAGQLLAFILANILGIPLYNPITDLTIHGSNNTINPPELQQITLKLLGVLFLLAALVLEWLDKRRIRNTEDALKA